MTKEEALREENELCDLEQKGSISLGRTVTGRPVGENTEKPRLEPLRTHPALRSVSGIISSGNIAVDFAPVMAPFSAEHLASKTESHQLGA